MRKLAAPAAAVLTIAVIACGGGSAGNDSAGTAVATGGIDIRGKVTVLTTPAEGVSAGALVEGVVEGDTRYERAWVRITEATVILRKQGAETIPAAVAELQVGTTVEVKFEGVVAELDPVQASAGEIRILE